MFPAPRASIFNVCCGHAQKSGDLGYLIEKYMLFATCVPSWVTHQSEGAAAPFLAGNIPARADSSSERKGKGGSDGHPIDSDKLSWKNSDYNNCVRYVWGKCQMEGGGIIEDLWDEVCNLSWETRYDALARRTIECCNASHLVFQLLIDRCVRRKYLRRMQPRLSLRTCWCKTGGTGHGCSLSQRRTLGRAGGMAMDQRKPKRQGVTHLRRIFHLCWLKRLREFKYIVLSWPLKNGYYNILNILPNVCDTQGCGAINMPMRSKLFLWIWYHVIASHIWQTNCNFLWALLFPTTFTIVWSKDISWGKPLSIAKIIINMFSNDTTWRLEHTSFFLKQEIMDTQFQNSVLAIPDK